MRKGRALKVRFAPNSTAVKVKNLTPYVTNELLEKAFSIFGDVSSKFNVSEQLISNIVSSRFWMYHVFARPSDWKSYHYHWWARKIYRRGCCGVCSQTWCTYGSPKMFWGLLFPNSVSLLLWRIKVLVYIMYKYLSVFLYLVGRSAQLFLSQWSK